VRTGLDFAGDELEQLQDAVPPGAVRGERYNA